MRSPIKPELDPLDVRKRNLYERGRDMTPYGMKVEDNIALELVERARTDQRLSRSAARRSRHSTPGAQSCKKGLALTPVKFGISFTSTHLNQAGALVHVYTDGSVHLNHGGTEMGQGLYIKVAQVVAEEFGIEPDRVKITATTTGKVPNTSPTAASSGSDLNGMAAKEAAATHQRTAHRFCRRGMEGAKSRRSVSNKGQVIIGNQSIAFGDLAKKAHQARISLSSTGFYATPKITWDRRQGAGHAFLLFRLWRGLLGSHYRHADRRNAGRPRRYPS